MYMYTYKYAYLNTYNYNYNGVLYIVHVRRVRCTVYAVQCTRYSTSYSHYPSPTLSTMYSVVHCTTYSVRRTVYVESEKSGEDIEKKDRLNYDEREIEMRRKSYRMVAIYGTSQR